MEAGSVVTVQQGVIHDVLAGGGTALSVHAYSPPLTMMSFYDNSGRQIVERRFLNASPSNFAGPASSGPPPAATIETVVEVARRRIEPRTAPCELASAMNAGTLVVDTRPVEQRQRDGQLPGAHVVERNALEWRLDPTSPHRLPGFDDAARPVVIVCDEGYASSLAAASLRDLGLTNVTDLEGGFQAWRAHARAGDLSRAEP